MKYFTPRLRLMKAQFIGNCLGVKYTKQTIRGMCSVHQRAQNLHMTNSVSTGASVVPAAKNIHSRRGQSEVDAMFRLMHGPEHLEDPGCPVEVIVRVAARREKRAVNWQRRRSAWQKHQPDRLNNCRGRRPRSLSAKPIDHFDHFDHFDDFDDFDHFDDFDNVDNPDDLRMLQEAFLEAAWALGAFTPQCTVINNNGQVSIHLDDELSAHVLKLFDNGD